MRRSRRPVPPTRYRRTTMSLATLIKSISGRAAHPKESEMRIRNATVAELRSYSASGLWGRNPERDGAFAEAIAKAKRGRAQVVEATDGEKTATIRAALNGYIKRNEILGVRVSALPRG